VALGIAVSVALIWFAFRDTPFADVWTEIRAVRVLPMLAAVIVATLPFPLRVPRWALLLRREDGSAIPTRDLWHAIAVGFAANNVLPLRLGEVVRMGAISRLAKVPFPSALSSVAVERIIDALVAVGLFGLGLLVIDLPVDASTADKATLVGILALTALVGAVAVARWPALATRPLKTLLPAGRLRETLLGFVDRVVLGLTALGDPRHAIPVFAWSVVIWLVNAAAFWIAFRAFDITVPFTGALILQGALLVGIAVPSSPGYAGVFEAAIKVSLVSLFGVPPDVALAYAITYHVLTFIPITLLGVTSLLTTGLTFRGAREAAR
jgi:uncharacterized protein (TIRG00374 family)